MCNLNEQLLLKKIDESRLSRDSIAKSIGITRQAFFNKINGKREFKTSEMNKLAEILNLSIDDRDAIFFADCVDK